MANLSLRARRQIARGFSRRDVATIGRKTFTGIGNRATKTIGAGNASLTYIAKQTGTGGNAIRVAIVVAGNSTPLSVSVAGNDITVNSATSAGGAATSTAHEVKNALLANAAAQALIWTQVTRPGADGTGVVAANTLAAGALTGAV